MNRPDASRVFYGWYVVAAAFAVTFVGFGSAYTFSAFVESLQRDFAASRGQISLVFSLAGFLYFGFGIVSGPLADRFGSRRLAVAGMLLTGIGAAAAGAAHTLVQVYVAYGPVSVSASAARTCRLSAPCSAGSCAGAASRRGRCRRDRRRHAGDAAARVRADRARRLARCVFHAGRDRGRDRRGDGVADRERSARARAAAGRGGGAWPVEGGGAKATARDAGRSVSGAAASRKPAAGATVREAVTSRSFASLYAACLICSFGVFVPFVHLVPYALDHGVSSSTAVLLLGAIGVGSTAGRFFLGGLADRFGRRTSLLAMFAGMAVALVAWAGAGTVATLAAFALGFGVFYGGWVAVLPAVVMDYFGGRNVSGIIGVLYTSVAFGTLIGPTAAGFIYDAGGGYLVPILASAAANAIAFAIVATTGRASTAARAARG